MWDIYFSEVYGIYYFRCVCDIFVGRAYTLENPEELLVKQDEI